MKPLIIAAQAQPPSRLKDDSVTLKYITKEEISTDLFSRMDNYRRVNGWLIFSPDLLDESIIPKTRAVEEDQSPSQRLRGALYLLYKRRGRGDEEWQAFYDREMERIRQTVINNLE